MATHVKVTQRTNQMLHEMSTKRKREDALVRTKMDIAAEAIAIQFKKEMQ